jgi:hypothetical protein
MSSLTNLLAGFRIILHNNLFDMPINYLIIVTIVTTLSLYDSHDEQHHNRYKNTTIAFEPRP